MILTKGKSLQQVSDEIAEKLLEQGKPCMDSEGVDCVYGDGEGNHCAVGWLLPDDREDLMNFTGAVQDLVGLMEDFDDPEFLGPNSEFIKVNQPDLDDIQRIHDHPFAEQRRMFIRCLEKKGLDMILWKKWDQLKKDRVARLNSPITAQLYNA